MCAVETQSEFATRALASAEFCLFHSVLLTFSCSQFHLPPSCSPSNKHLKWAFGLPSFFLYPAVKCSKENKENRLDSDCSETSRSHRSHGGEEKSARRCQVAPRPRALGRAGLPRPRNSGAGLSLLERIQGRRLLHVEVAVSCVVFESRSNFQPFNYSQLWFFFSTLRCKA